MDRDKRSIQGRRGEHARLDVSDSISIDQSEMDVTYNDLNPKDYNSSSFPSLLGIADPKLRDKQRTKQRKKAEFSLANNKADVTSSRRRDNDPMSFWEGTQRRKGYSSDDAGSKTQRRREQEQLSFGESLRKRNEDQWLRIEAVCQDKLDRYDKYAADMTAKLRKQRSQINRRAKEILDNLARQEEKKREDRIYFSSHGRMWRHHRSMQRRVYNLEPINGQRNGLYSCVSRSACAWWLKPETTAVLVPGYTPESNDDGH